MKVLPIKDTIDPADLDQFEEEGISHQELQALYHFTCDRLQRILIRELARARNIFIEQEPPKVRA